MREVTRCYRTVVSDFRKLIGLMLGCWLASRRHRITI